MALPATPPAAHAVIEGEVVCDHCPAAPVYVLAYAAVDRYHWPWWDVYGVLGAVHTPAALDAMRPAPLAMVKLDRPGRFRLSLPGTSAVGPSSGPQSSRNKCVAIAKTG